MNNNIWSIRKHYKIFLSSTFKDMDLERDIFKTRVIPILNYKYRVFNIDFQVIDLRFGIDTSTISEDMATQKVMNRCLDAIDISHPFFIAFIGNRYGWIPNDEQWYDFYNHLTTSQKVIMKNTIGLSITEMEIYYSLSHADRNTYNIFCIRDNRSLDTLCKDQYREYIETQINGQKKLSALKNKLYNICKNNSSSSYITYSIDFTNTQMTLDIFAQKLIDKISFQVDKELNQYGYKNFFATLKIWQEESLNTINVFLNASNGSLCRAGEQYLEHGNVVVLGQQYSGKTTLLARHFNKLYNEDLISSPTDSRKILLVGIVNSSMYSRTMKQIMGRWIIELARLCNVMLDEEFINKLTTAGSLNEKDIIDIFYTFVDTIISVGHSVHIFLDDIDQLAIFSPDDDFLSWIDGRVTLYVSATSIYNVSLEILKNLNFTVLDFSNMVIDESGSYLESLQSRYVCELPKKIKDEIKYNSSTFLHLSTLFTIVNLLNEKDFTMGRTMDNYEDFMYDKITHLYKTIPESYWEVFDFLLDFYINRSGCLKILPKILGLISHSPIGLREHDILSIINEKISSLDLYEMLYYFKTFIVIENSTGLIHFKHFRKDFFSSKIYSLLLDYVSELPIDDWFREAFLKFNYINDTSLLLHYNKPENLFWMSKTCSLNHKYDEALKYIDNSIHIYTQAKNVDPDYLYKLYHEKMLIYMCLYEYVCALSVCNYLSKLKYSSINKIRISLIYTKLDNFLELYANHENELALSKLLGYESEFRSFYNDDPISMFLYNSVIANLYSDIDNAEKTYSYRLKSLMYANKFPQSLSVCLAYVFWNLSLEESNDCSSDILDNALLAVDIFEKCGYIFSDLPSLYEYVGDLYNYNNDSKKAISYYEDALTKLLILDKDDITYANALRLKIIQLTKLNN